MITIKDIIQKEISAVGTSEHLIYDPGYIPGISSAWVHPGGLYALLLTESEIKEFNVYGPIQARRAPYVSKEWDTARICEDFINRSLVLGGKRRKLWCNESRDVGEGRYYALANTLFSRLKISGCDVYQATIKPYAYFLVMNGRPYAQIMPVRLAHTEEGGV